MLFRTPIDTILTFTFVQDGQDATVGPAAPGQESATTQVADDSALLGTEQKSSNPLGDNFFMILMLLLVGMIVFSFFGGRKQKKKRAAMLGALKKHDQVLTRGGVYGSVIEIKTDRVVLKVDESSNTRITVHRDSIEQVTTESADT